MTIKMTQIDEGRISLLHTEGGLLTPNSRGGRSDTAKMLHFFAQSLFSRTDENSEITLKLEIVARP